MKEVIIFLFLCLCLANNIFSVKLKNRGRVTQLRENITEVLEFTEPVQISGFLLSNWRSQSLKDWLEYQKKTTGLYPIFLGSLRERNYTYYICRPTYIGSLSDTSLMVKFNLKTEDTSFLFLNSEEFQDAKGIPLYHGKWLSPVVYTHNTESFVPSADRREYQLYDGKVSITRFDFMVFRPITKLTFNSFI